MNRQDTNRRRGRVVRAGIALAVCARLCGEAGAGLHAQTSTPQEPRFEVVSVKRNTGGAVGSFLGAQPGGFSVRNLSVRQVILFA